MNTWAVRGREVEKRGQKERNKSYEVRPVSINVLNILGRASVFEKLESLTQL